VERADVRPLVWLDESDDVENAPPERNLMSADVKKGYGSTLVLIAMGLVALYARAQWLAILIPAAILVFYGATRTMLGRGGN
jgi:hypothetical protein